MNNEKTNLDTSAFKQSAAPRLIKSRRAGTSHCSLPIERQRRATPSVISVANINDQRSMTNDQKAIETPTLLSAAQRRVSLRPQGRLITHCSLSGSAAPRRATPSVSSVISVANIKDQKSMTNDQKQGTPKILLIAHCSLIIERQRRVATPYSSNSYLLTPQCSAKSVQSVQSVDSPLARRPLIIDHCSLIIERQRRAAFSLAEILIAIFVLSIGLLMIASVFPVAAKWTAEDAQTSIAQVIAKNAVEQIQTQGLIPAGGGIVGPYCYNFGASSPYPNANPAPYPVAFTTPPAGGYYWTAYALPATYAAGSGGVFPGTQVNQYTIFVFVFNKGDLNNTFPIPPALSKTVGTSTIAMMAAYPQNGTPSGQYYPQLYSDTLGDVVTATPSGLPMPIGSLGVDVTTGQVFREIVDPTTNALTITGIPESSTSPNPYLRTGDTIIFAPAAINQTASPLVYVYVTTVNL